MADLHKIRIGTSHLQYLRDVDGLSDHQIKMWMRNVFLVPFDDEIEICPVEDYGYYISSVPQIFRSKESVHPRLSSKIINQSLDSNEPTDSPATVRNFQSVQDNTEGQNDE